MSNVPTKLGGINKHGSPKKPPTMPISTGLMERHNKSIQDMGCIPTDQVSSWVDSQQQPTHRLDSTDPVTDAAEAKGLPTVMLMSEDLSAAPHILVATESTLGGSSQAVSRVALMQSRLNCDSQGNILAAIQMNPLGRYQPLKPDDPAIRKIDLEEYMPGSGLLVPENESKNTLSGCSLTQRMQIRSQHQQQKSQHSVTPPTEHSTIHETETEKSEEGTSRQVLVSPEAAPDTPAPTPAPTPARAPGKKFNLAHLASLMNDKLPASTDGSSDTSSTVPHKPALSDKSALGSLAMMLKGQKGALAEQVGTMVALKKWRTGVAGGNEVFTMRMFARDDHHYNFLTKNEEHMAVDVPMPLKITMFEEVCPIIHDLHKEYLKVIGKDHDLTEEALTRWKELIELKKVLDEL